MASTSGGVPRSQAPRNLDSVLSSSGRGKDAPQEEAERSEVFDTLHRLGGWKWSKVFPYGRISHLHFTVGSMFLTPLRSSQGTVYCIVAPISFDYQRAILCHAKVKKLSMQSLEVLM